MSREPVQTNVCISHPVEAATENNDNTSALLPADITGLVLEFLPPDKNRVMRIEDMSPDEIQKLENKIHIFSAQQANDDKKRKDSLAALRADIQDRNNALLNQQVALQALEQDKNAACCYMITCGLWYFMKLPLNSVLGLPFMLETSLNLMCHMCNDCSTPHGHCVPETCLFPLALPFIYLASLFCPYEIEHYKQQNDELSKGNFIPRCTKACTEAGTFRFFAYESRDTRVSDCCAPLATAAVTYKYYVRAKYNLEGYKATTLPLIKKTADEVFKLTSQLNTMQLMK